MDPLTHTLVGANLAATRLGKITPMATAALVIGANVPDVDVFSYLWGEDFAMGFRRGWTHGPLALVVLPLLLTGLLLAWDRFVRRDPARQARAGPLLLLAFLAALTHPALDWLNIYGMRWLMPFDGTWYYGDSVFIMDPWLWLILGGTWLAGRRLSIGLLVTWGIFTALLAAVVQARAGTYVPAVLAVSGGLLLALLWRPPNERTGERLAQLGLIIGALFIGILLGLHQFTRLNVQSALADQGIENARRVMTGPRPINPLHWDVVVERDDHYRFGSYRWPGGLTLDDNRLSVPGDDLIWRKASAHPSVAGFMTWTRFPWYEVEQTAQGTLVHIMDARYSRSVGTGFGTTRVLLEPD
ncbi:MAG: metal-dependent hydrolase [Xanthomonadales bacterium]|nr:metal-dependent hydrolase [Xanthomonadales bacterium]